MNEQIGYESLSQEQQQDLLSKLEKAVTLSGYNAEQVVLRLFSLFLTISIALGIPEEEVILAVKQHYAKIATTFQLQKHKD